MVADREHSLTINTISRGKRREFAFLSGFVFIISPFLALPIILLEVYSRKRGALLFLSMFMGILTYLLLPDWTLDIARYYQGYDTIGKYNYQEFTEYLKLRTDYVFYFLFFVFSQLGLKVQILLFILSTFNFYVVFYVYEKIALRYNVSRSTYFNFLILLFFSISILYYLSATRFSLACSFLTLALYNFYFQEKKIRAYILFVFAILVHVAVLVYVPFILLIQNIKNKKTLILISISIFVLLLFMPIGLIMDNLFTLFSGFSEKALIYIEMSERESNWSLRLSHISIIATALFFIINFYKTIPSLALNVLLLSLLPVLVTFPFGFWVYDRFMVIFKIIFVYVLFTSSFYSLKKLTLPIIKSAIYLPFLLYYAYSLYLYRPNMVEYFKIDNLFLVSILSKTYTVNDILFL